MRPFHPSNASPNRVSGAGDWRLTHSARGRKRLWVSVVLIPYKVLRWMEDRAHTRRRVSYVVGGLMLGLAAPVGLLVMRAALARDSAPGWLGRELSGNVDIYVYLTLVTCLLFVGLGRVLGAQADELRAASISDSLTGLSNRRYFDQRLRQEVDRASRYKQSLSLLLIDVDYLKRINDEHGHIGGDAALVAVGDSLRRTCRTSDLPVRFAGDEFAVIAPCTTAMEARRLAERIQESLTQASTAVGKLAGQAVTVSIGIADLLADIEPGAQGLVETADRALYEAKAAGRNRTSIASRVTPESWAGNSRDEPTVKLRTRPQPR